MFQVVNASQCINPFLKINRKKTLTTFLCHLQNSCEISPVHEVVCLEEDLSKSALTHGVVLRIELVESMEGVSIL